MGGGRKERNQMEFHSVKNRKENYHYDRIPLNVKGNIVSSVNSEMKTV